MRRTRKSEAATTPRSDLALLAVELATGASASFLWSRLWSSKRGANSTVEATATSTVTMSEPQRTTGLTSSTLLTQELRAAEAALAASREEVSHLRRRLAEEDTTPPPPLLSGPPPRRANSVSSAASSSMLTWRTSERGGARPRGRRSAGALSALSDMLTREFWDPAEREEAELRDVAAVRLQAAWRGGAARRRYAGARRLHAVVSGSVQLRGDGVRVPAYVITVVRRGCCWEVQHRFSDWLALHRRLGELGVGPLPSAPARLPFRGYAVTRHREYALNRYLQAALPAAEPSPRGRALLLRFLCRSHMHWLYEPDARAAPLPRVRDVSTGATPRSNVRDAGEAGRAASPPQRGGAGGAPLWPWQQAPAAPPDMFR